MTFAEFLIFLDEYWELFGPVPIDRPDPTKYKNILL